MKIEVTQEDINLGVPQDTALCPVARAMARCTGHAWIVDADSFVSDDEDIEIIAPVRASQFIRSFDDCQPVTPIQFDIDLPTERRT